MTRRVLTVAAVAVVFPASATATTHYFLKAHQRCRAGYARRTVKVKQREQMVTIRRAECVRRATPAKRQRTPTTTFVNTSSSTTAGSTVWFSLSASVYAAHHEIDGLPLKYTVTDATTRQVVGTFTGTSNGNASCTIATSVNEADNVETYTGQAVAPYPACSLGSIGMPAADIPIVTASFAGKSAYRPSTSVRTYF